jgi:cytochrome c553
MKKRIIFSLLLVLVIISGCEDKKTKEEISENVGGEIKITENAIKEQQASQTEASDKGKFYYSYNQEEAQETKEAQERTYTPVQAYQRVRSPYERVQIELLANKLSKNFIVHCSACHDDYANGIIGPSLLDKDENFIYQRLIAYKKRTKVNVLMKDLVTKMSEKELKALAKEIADFNQKIRKLRAGKKVD